MTHQVKHTRVSKNGLPFIAGQMKGRSSMVKLRKREMPLYSEENWIFNILKFAENSARKISNYIKIPIVVVAGGVLNNKSILFVKPRTFEFYLKANNNQLAKEVMNQFKVYEESAVLAGMIVIRISNPKGLGKLPVAICALSLNVLEILRKEVKKHKFLSIILFSVLHEAGHVVFGDNEIAANQWVIQNAKHLFPYYVKSIEEESKQHIAHVSKGRFNYAGKQIAKPSKSSIKEAVSKLHKLQRMHRSIVKKELGS